jgi:LacI family transcriptional regulator
MYMRGRKQVTLKDIAGQLNISTVAVSKALRDHPDISRATKKLVGETAQKLGYLPDFVARNLSSRKSNTIGLVIPKIAHHFFSLAIESIYQTAYEKNYEIIMTVSQENAQNEIKHIQTLLAMRVDGLLISVTEQTRDLHIFEYVRDLGVPLVFFDRVIEGLGFSCVITDDYKSSLSTTRRLLESGFNDIVHLAGYQHTSIGKKRLDGFKHAFAEKGIPFSAGNYIEGGFGEEDGYSGFVHLHEKGKVPQVIFTVTFPVALGVLLAAEEANIRVPQDLHIISFGGSNYNRFIKPSLTYIEQPIEEIGRIATELLFEEIRLAKGPSGRLIELPTNLVFCDTCNKF